MFCTYSVQSGPDNSHLWDVKHFDRLYKAKEYIQTLPLTVGKERPYNLNKLVYRNRKDHFPCDIVIIEKRRIHYTSYA